MPVTFVTGLLDLGLDAPKDKTIEDRCRHFSSLINTGISLYLFLSPSYKSEYDRLIGDQPNVTIEYIEFTDLETYRCLEGIDYKIPSKLTKIKDTKSFMIMINAKIELVCRAKVKATHLAWIDFNVFHVFKKSDTPAYLQRLGDSEPQGLFIPGCWSPREPSFAAICWRFCGGFFIGDRASIEKMYDTQKAMFKDIVITKGLAWEVNVWAWMEHTGKLKCTWLKANHNDTLIRLPEEAFSLK